MGEDVLVVHGDRGRVVAQRAELVRQAAGGRARVVETASQTAVVMYARKAGPGSLVFVDIGGEDSLGLDRPGERLLRRLARSPGVRARLVACAAVDSPGAAGWARAAGADAYAAGPQPQMREAIQAILDGKAPWPSAVTAHRRHEQQQPRYPAASMPQAGVTLHRAAQALREPSLLAAAQLSRSDATLVGEIDRLVRCKRRQDAAQGALTCDDVRGERRTAALAYVAEHGVTGDDVEPAVQRVLSRLDGALSAVADALRDELYHPQARAALALSMLDPDQAWRVDGAAIDLDGNLTWRGVSVDTIAADSTLHVGELRGLWEAIDGLLAARENGANAGAATEPSSAGGGGGRG